MTIPASDGLDIVIVTVDLPTLVGVLSSLVPGGSQIANALGQKTGQMVSIHASDLLIIGGLGIAISPFVYQLIQKAGGAAGIAGAVAGL